MPIFFVLFALLLAVPVIWPQVDLSMSGLFFRDGQFYLADNLFCVTLHWIAYDGARVLGVAFAVFACVSKLRGRAFCGVDAKAGLFLLLALLIGPGLVANIGLKDHWGRYRPREVSQFGGPAQFTPVLEPHFEHAHSNGSFVAGDAAFGFFLPAFAYVVPRRRSRRVFWVGMMAGALFGFVRLVMGAHFFSDVLYAAFCMLTTVAGVHAVMYGRRETVMLWRGWFKRPSIV